MNEMHFEGTILTADLHDIPEPGKSSIQLMVQFDITEECMIEEYGTTDELMKKFECNLPGINETTVNLTGRHCKILRNAQGYHFVSFIKL